MHEALSDPSISTAERILASRFNTALRLLPLETSTTGRSRSLRCRVVGAPEHVPKTVFVKQFLERPDHAGLVQEAFLREWAACRFLNAVPSEPPLAPLLYGGDLQRRLLVFEDFGAPSGPNTEQLLLRQDPEAAERSLVEHVTLLARLHGLTLGRSAELRSIWETLGPLPQPTPLYTDPWSDARLTAPAPEEIGAVIHRHEAVCNALGIRASGGVGAEIGAVTARVEIDPGPFLAFCKGDQNLAGDFLQSPSGPRLFDYDCGGFRHALIEGMPGRMTWGCALRIPEEVVRRMDTTYWNELARHCAAARDDATYQRARADAAARWHIFHVVWRIPQALRLPGDRQRGPSTLRQQVLAWLDAFESLAEEGGHYPALAETAAAMRNRLHSRWDTPALPYYPAFT